MGYGDVTDSVHLDQSQANPVLQPNEKGPRIAGLRLKAVVVIPQWLCAADR